MYGHVIFFLMILFAGCGKAPLLKDTELAKPLILVSIAPYQFLVEKIGGAVCSVKTIVPPRSNPHAFEPTARQVAEISKGQIWFRIGEPFEEKILALLKPKLFASDLREGIDLQPEDNEHACDHCFPDHLDRHIWLSPKLAGQQAAAIAKVLSNHFPEHKEEFQRNLVSFLEEIELLDLEIRSLLAPLEGHSLIVSHSAFGYFCREYRLEQLSVEQEGKDPRPRHVEAMLEKAKRFPAAIVLALPQHNNKGAQIIAKEMNVPIRMVDPYAADYFKTMRKLARLIADPHYEAIH